MPTLWGRIALATLLTVAATPAAAHAEAYRLDARFDLEPASRLEAVPSNRLTIPPLSVGLSVATPLALTSLGGGLLAISGYPSEVNAVSVMGMAVGAMAPLALGAGQVYGGDPERGFWVGLGAYGMIAGSLLLSLGAASVVDSQAMSPAGRSAGSGAGLLALSIGGAMTAGYTIWALLDAYQTSVRHNASVSDGSQD